MIPIAAIIALDLCAVAIILALVSRHIQRRATYDRIREIADRYRASDEQAWGDVPALPVIFQINSPIHEVGDTNVR